MITVRIDGLDYVRRQMDGLGRQLPFVISRAINDTAFKVRATEQSELRATLDRPKPWTLRQIRVTKSTKQNLVSTIKPDTPRASAILSTHIRGGRRGLRGAERMLQAAGLMPRGWYVVPSDSAGIRIDSYGNMTMASWRMLLRARSEQRLFISLQDHPRTRHLPPGIYRRTNRGHLIEALVFFEQSTRYQPRIRWVETALTTVQREFRPAFDAAVAYAMRTRR